MAPRSARTGDSTGLSVDALAGIGYSGGKEGSIMEEIVLMVIVFVLACFGLMILFALIGSIFQDEIEERRFLPKIFGGVKFSKDNTLIADFRLKLILFFTAAVIACVGTWGIVVSKAEEREHVKQEEEQAQQRAQQEEQQRQQQMQEMAKAISDNGIKVIAPMGLINNVLTDCEDCIGGEEWEKIKSVVKNSTTSHLIGSAEGKYTVVERSEDYLTKLLKEQRLSLSDLTDARTAIKVGKLLSADCIAIYTFEARIDNDGEVHNSSTILFNRGYCYEVWDREAYRYDLVRIRLIETERGSLVWNKRMPITLQ